MLLSVLNETKQDPRVAITPNTVKQYKNLGLDLHLETGLGSKAGFTDAAYQDAGAILVDDKEKILKKTNILLCMNAPKSSALTHLKKEALVVAPIDNDDPLIAWAAKHSIHLLSMNLIPRISRAQNMDILSSQANLAGYRAVIEGVSHFNRAVPMMMTAAGMIHPAKILILGAGVAGLQAIATAKRLGAVVYAFDVRQAAKEQVESLGAEFIQVEDADNQLETEGGYAKEATAAYQKKQAKLIHDYALLSDIVVSTALIPNKKAPLLLLKETIEAMKKGSVIVDLATAKGGNCELSKKNKLIDVDGVTIIGYSNMAGLVAATASDLYANNLLQLVKLLIPKGSAFNFDDEIIQQSLLSKGGLSNG